jgi:hypothetical protein
MNLNKLSKPELLEKCQEFGISKCKSKSKTELIQLIDSYKMNITKEEDKIKVDDKVENLNDNNYIIENIKPEIEDLFKLNKDIIKSTIKDEHIINLINKNYNRSKIKSDNIYSFIYSYINAVKLLHQDYKSFDYVLYNSIISNKNIKILWGNCLDKLKMFPNESVGLMCTSPPYYNARDYSVWNNLNDYLNFMTEIIKECYRVLDNHRVFVFNVSDVVDNDNLGFCLTISTVYIFQVYIFHV